MPVVEMHRYAGRSEQKTGRAGLRTFPVVQRVEPRARRLRQVLNRLFPLALVSAKAIDAMRIACLQSPGQKEREVPIILDDWPDHGHGDVMRAQIAYRLAQGSILLGQPACGEHDGLNLAAWHQHVKHVVAQSGAARRAAASNDRAASRCRDLNDVSVRISFGERPPELRGVTVAHDNQVRFLRTDRDPVLKIVVGVGDLREIAPGSELVNSLGGLIVMNIVCNPRDGRGYRSHLSGIQGQPHTHYGEHGDARYQSAYRDALRADPVQDEVTLIDRALRAVGVDPAPPADWETTAP